LIVSEGVIRRNRGYAAEVCQLRVPCQLFEPGDCSLKDRLDMKRRDEFGTKLVDSVLKGADDR